MPRILVRINGSDRHENKTEKTITANNGQQIKLYLAPIAEDVALRKEELAVQIGEVIGLGPGCEGYEIGDTVLMDYNVDSDEQYLVRTEDIEKALSLQEATTDSWNRPLRQGDKIVSVPCKTTYHDTRFSITSYGLRKSATEYIYTGERNMLIWDVGDVNELSLIYGIIRNTPDGPSLIPNDYWIFCEHEPERSESMEAVNGIMAYRKYDDTYVKRNVLFCGGIHSGFQSGDTIYAVPGAAIPVTVHDVKFDVIACVDIFGVEDGAVLK